MLKNHRSNNNNINNNNKKYIPPRTEKKELKKEFSLQSEAFPTLSAPTSKRPALSFAQAAQTALIKKPVSESETLPGWIYIRNNGGKIEYKSGPPRSNGFYKTEEEEDARLGRLLVKYRLAKEQYERDNDVLRLGDFSEYYNTKTLQEQFDEEDIIMLKADYLSSDSSDFE